MYTTGDLDKSTHKKLMYVDSQHMSERWKNKNKNKTEKDVGLQRDKKLSKFYTGFLNVNSHMCCATYQLSAVANNLWVLYTGGVFCTKYENYHLIIVMT